MLSLRLLMLSFGTSDLLAAPRLCSWRSGTWLALLLWDVMAQFRVYCRSTWALGDGAATSGVLSTALSDDLVAFNNCQVDWAGAFSAAGGLPSLDGGIDPSGVDFDGLER